MEKFSGKQYLLAHIQHLRLIVKDYYESMVLLENNKGYENFIYTKNVLFAMTMELIFKIIILCDWIIIEEKIDKDFLHQKAIKLMKRDLHGLDKIFTKVQSTSFWKNIEIKPIIEIEVAGKKNITNYFSILLSNNEKIHCENLEGIRYMGLATKTNIVADYLRLEHCILLKELTHIIEEIIDKTRKILFNTTT